MSSALAGMPIIDVPNLFVIGRFNAIEIVIASAPHASKKSPTRNNNNASGYFFLISFICLSNGVQICSGNAFAVGAGGSGGGVLVGGNADAVGGSGKVRESSAGIRMPLRILDFAFALAAVGVSVAVTSVYGAYCLLCLLDVRKSARAALSSNSSLIVGLPRPSKGLRTSFKVADMLPIPYIITAYRL